MNRRRTWPSRCKPHIYFARGKWHVRSYNGVFKRTCATHWKKKADAFYFAQLWRLS